MSNALPFKKPLHEFKVGGITFGVYQFSYVEGEDMFDGLCICPVGARAIEMQGLVDPNINARLEFLENRNEGGAVAVAGGTAPSDNLTEIQREKAREIRQEFEKRIPSNATLLGLENYTVSSTNPAKLYSTPYDKQQSIALFITVPARDFSISTLTEVVNGVQQAAITEWTKNKMVDNIIDAPSEEAVQRYLKEQGYFVSKIAPKGEDPLSPQDQQRGKFLEALARLLNEHFPGDENLEKRRAIFKAASDTLNRGRGGRGQG